MPDLQFEREQQRFNVSGVDLNRPVDSVKQNKAPILENVRSYQDGRVEPRTSITGIADVVTSKTPTHSARRLNDDINSTWTRVVGVQDRVATGQTSFTNRDGPYS